MLLIFIVVAALLGSPTQWNEECRGYGAEGTVRCISAKQNPPGGVEKALAVWRCESGFEVEPPHDDSYHGPYQYSADTYESQREKMPDLVRWFDLSALVHDARSNIVMAVGYASRFDWGPWSCA